MKKAKVVRSWTVLLCWLAVVAAQAEPVRTVEKLRKSVAEAANIRDRLARELRDRVRADAKAGANCDLLLRLEEGADREEMHVVLRRRGKDWLTSYAVVPAWRQESFYEYFSYLTRGRNKAIMYDKWRFPVDAGPLSFDGAALTGKAAAVLKLDRTREERFPAGTPTRWAKTGQTFTFMELCNARNHHKNRVQSYVFDVEKVDGAYEFDLRLKDAVAKRCTLQTRFQVPAQPWVRGTAWALGFNCGYHAVDAVGMSVEDGVLRGPLMVAINPDRWYPKKPHYMVYNLEVKLDGKRCTGTYRGEGDFGECEGAVRGEAGEFVAGSYRASGDLGVYESMVFGRAMVARAEVAGILTPLTEVKGADSGAARMLAKQLSDVYGDIRALSLAIREYPFPIENALLQTKAALPEWGGADEPLTPEQAASIEAFAEDTVRLAASAKEADGEVVLGMPDTGDPAFGPFGGLTPLPEAATNSFALPAEREPGGPQKWGYVPYWRILGPFPRYDMFDANPALLPDIVPAEGAAYEGMAPGKLPKGAKRPDRFMHTWKKLASTRGKVQAPWSKFATRKGSYGSVWFARATLVSDTARDVWLAAAVEAHGKLWVNGKLAWVADEYKWRNHQGREAIFKVSLRKGGNELLMRCREDRNEAFFRFYVCTQGGPDPASGPRFERVASDAEITGTLGNGAGHFLKAENPPLAWDIEEGKNLAWTSKLPGRAISGVVAGGGKLFACCAPDLVVCIDQATGKALWRKRVPDVGENARGVLMTDGETVWVGFGGQIAAYETDGAEKWRFAVDGDRIGLASADGKLIVESGYFRGHDEPHACAAFDAATGAKLWSVNVPGSFGGGAVRILRLRNGDKRLAAVVLPSLRVLSLKDGSLLCSRPSCDVTPGYKVYLADDMVVFGRRSRVEAFRYVLDTHGQVGVRRLWRSQYGIKYDTHKMLLATDRYMLVIGTVQEDCKGHSNAAIREVYAYDRETGRPIKRIKPLLLRAQGDGTQSTLVGPYAFMHDAGGGASGGHPTSGQIGIVRVDGEPEIVARNMIPKGSATPVFAGERMFLAVGDTVHAIAVTGGKGRKYQDEKLAEALFENLWDVPKADKFARPSPLAEKPPYGTLPVSRLENAISLAHWMVAGPFPLPARDEPAAVRERLAGLTPALGDSLELGGAKRCFEALPQEAVKVGYQSGGEYYLCGLGTGKATVFREVDVLSCTGGKKDRCGILYTVVENVRARVALIDMPKKGVDAWLGGMPMKPSLGVQLDPGCYPLVVRVRPDRMGKKPGAIRIGFHDRDDPRAALRYWLGRVNAREDAVKQVARRLRGTALGEKAVRYLAELSEYKATLDLRDRVRSVNGAGRYTFENARPPVPWERGANLRWRCELPGEVERPPVASGDFVFVSLKPNRLVCCGREDGKIAWSAEVAGASGLSAPAATKDAVYVASGDSLVRYRFDGSVVWSRPIEGGRGTPSLRPAGGMLVVHSGGLSGVDPSSGDTAWTSKDPVGSVAVARVGAKAVLLTGAGAILDPNTGEVVSKGLPKTGSIAPQFAKGVLYSAAGRDVFAHRLSAGRAPESLWRAAVDDAAFGTPLVLDGLVYVLSENGDITVIDADKGGKVGRYALGARPKAGVSALLLGGIHLFAANLGDGTKTKVLSPGEEPACVWEYAVAGGGTLPSFLGDSLFVAASKALFRVGGEAPVQPGQYTPRPVARALGEGAPTGGMPVVPFEDNQMPMRWLFSGVIKPATLETDFLAGAGTREKAEIVPGKTIRHGEQEFAFAPMDAARSIWSHPKFTAGFDAVCVRSAVAVDGPKEQQRNDESTVYLYTLIDNEKPRFVELNVLTPGGETWNSKDQIQVRAWLGGVEIGDREVVEMAAGKIPFLMQVHVGICPSDGGKIWMAPRLVDRTQKYAGERDSFERLQKVWTAFKAAQDEEFVLK